MASTFLTARWEDLVLLNYVCPPRILESLVPRGTTLDLWEGDALVSLVGFLFRNTRIVGLRIPFHQTFEEVNLRFYVRRLTSSGETRRAVVFVRELVPRRAIAAVARWIYNEPYSAVSMGHRSSLTDTGGGAVAYSWSYRGQQFVLDADVRGPSQRLRPASEEEFITEHYWGYTRQRNGDTLEYQVEHPPWMVWKATAANFVGAGASLYGSVFGGVLAKEPRSAFVSTGSAVVVHRGVRLDVPAA